MLGRCPLGQPSLSSLTHPKMGAGVEGREPDPKRTQRASDSQLGRDSTCAPQGGHHTVEQALLRPGADPRKRSRVFPDLKCLPPRVCLKQVCRSADYWPCRKLLKSCSQNLTQFEPNIQTPDQTVRRVWFCFQRHKRETNASHSSYFSPQACLPIPSPRIKPFSCNRVR